VAVDDHARIAYTEMQTDETGACAAAFLRTAVAYYATLGVIVRRVLTDNGSPFRSNAWRTACAELHVTHKRTRAYRPQTNGKAERFIQSALREWAYGIAYDHSSERTAMLAKWQHHYNWHRPHAGVQTQARVRKERLDASHLATCAPQRHRTTVTRRAKRPRWPRPQPDVERPVRRAAPRSADARRPARSAG